MRLLFHCCCGPCAAGCIESLKSEGTDYSLFWYNPNIHPYTEYINRRDSLAQLAAAENIQLNMIDEYGLREFIQLVRDTVDKGPKSTDAQRCLLCYRMRLEKTAFYAKMFAYNTFSTSLLISPYQRHEEIRKIGEEIAERYSIPFFYRDFRPHFREGQKKARNAGLYMQKYCGCIFSEEERYNEE